MHERWCGINDLSSNLNHLTIEIITTVESDFMFLVLSVNKGAT